MSRRGEFGSIRHLAVRFFAALWPGGPSAADEAWALQWLVPGEKALWSRMSGPDRRHAVGVARTTAQLLGSAPGSTSDDPTERAVMASALLHDVGKVESGLGTLARAVLTGVALVTGRSRLASPPSPAAPDNGWRRRVRLYLTHDSVGAGLLEAAGSDGLTVAWAREHHMAPQHWTVPPRLADALKAADGD